MRLRNFIIALVLSAVAFGQTTILPKTTIIPKTTILGTVSSSGGAPVFVSATDSKATGFCGTGTSSCAASSLSVTANNALAAVAVASTTTAGAVIADNAGSTYTVGPNNTGSAGRIWTGYGLAGSTTATDAISSTLTTATNYNWVRGIQVSGVNLSTPVAAGEVAVSRIVFPTSPFNCPTITTAVNNSLVVCIVVDTAGVNDVWSPGAGFTLGATDWDTAVFSDYVEWQQQSIAGSITPQVNSTLSGSGIYLAMTIAFRHP